MPSEVPKTPSQASTASQSRLGPGGSTDSLDAALSKLALTSPAPKSLARSMSLELEDTLKDTQAQPMEVDELPATQPDSAITHMWDPAGLMQPIDPPAPSVTADNTQAAKHAEQSRTDADIHNTAPKQAEQSPTDADIGNTAAKQAAKQAEQSRTDADITTCNTAAKQVQQLPTDADITDMRNTAAKHAEQSRTDADITTCNTAAKQVHQLPTDADITNMRNTAAKHAEQSGTDADITTCNTAAKQVQQLPTDADITNTGNTPAAKQAAQPGTDADITMMCNTAAKHAEQSGRDADITMGNTAPAKQAEQSQRDADIIMGSTCEAKQAEQSGTDPGNVLPPVPAFTADHKDSPAFQIREVLTRANTCDLMMGKVPTDVASCQTNVYMEIDGNKHVVRVNMTEEMARKAGLQVVGDATAPPAPMSQAAPTNTERAAEAKTLQDPT